MTERYNLIQWFLKVVTGAKEEVDDGLADAIRAEAYADGFADGMEEAAEICDGYATVEGIAQKCAADIRAAIDRNQT